MRSCDLFVFPSRYEAHPLVLLEALASGLPVVVSDNFGASDYIHDGGIVFHDANDVSALTLAMEKLILSAKTRKTMSQAAREQALTMPWSRTTEGYLRIYDTLMRERAQPASEQSQKNGDAR